VVGRPGQVLLKVGAARNEAHITGRLGRAAKGINPRAAIV
jgi:hypothetical protein